MSDHWLEATSEDAFSEAGTTKDIFSEWQKTSEMLVKEKLITIGELKAAWGINKKPEKLRDAPDDESTKQDADPVPEQPAPVPMGAALPGMPAAPQPQMNMYSGGMQPPPMARGPSAVQQMMRQMGGFGQMQAMQQVMQTHTMTMQQTIVQQPQMPAVQKMAAVVPFGMYGGMQMTVDTPHGRMRVTIPPGYGPGSSFTFNVPRRF
jgi:hypothetical protein